MQVYLYLAYSLYYTNRTSLLSLLTGIRKHNSFTRMKIDSGYKTMKGRLGLSDTRLASFATILLVKMRRSQYICTSFLQSYNFSLNELRLIFYALCTHVKMIQFHLLLNIFLVYLVLMSRWMSENKSFGHQ